MRQPIRSRRNLHDGELLAKWILALRLMPHRTNCSTTDFRWRSVRCEQATGALEGANCYTREMVGSHLRLIPV